LRPPSRTTSDAPATPAVSPHATAGRIFRDGFLVALLNPKTAIFFAAFLPQFIDRHAEPMMQSVTLATLFVAIAATTDSTYALAAGSIAPLLKRTRGIQSAGRYLTGGAFIALGVLAAMTGSRSGQ
jgi:threonine/homoserine/homoserine lactone efflux protein